MSNYYVGPLDEGPGRQAPLNQNAMLQAVRPVLTTNQVPEPAPLQIEPPRERLMARRFTVIDSFDSDELKSSYVAGLSYTANEGDDVLLGLIDGWIKDGKVREGGPEAQMTAAGEITENPDAGESQEASPDAEKK